MIAYKKLSEVKPKKYSRSPIFASLENAGFKSRKKVVAYLTEKSRKKSGAVEGQKKNNCEFHNLEFKNLQTILLQHVILKAIYSFFAVAMFCFTL